MGLKQKNSFSKSWLKHPNFLYNKTPEEQKLLIVSFHLDVMARKWFSWMETSGFLSDWKAFVKSMIRKFSSAQFTIPDGKLSKLLQTSLVTEYVTQFDQEMCTRCLGSPDYFVLEMFISGLKEEIQQEVIKAKLDDLHEAFDVASFIEGQTST